MTTAAPQTGDLFDLLDDNDRPAEEFIYLGLGLPDAEFREQFTVAVGPLKGKRIWRDRRFGDPEGTRYGIDLETHDRQWWHQYLSDGKWIFSWEMEATCPACGQKWRRIYSPNFTQEAHCPAAAERPDRPVKGWQP
ncbi:hypothetical protein NQ036_03780 [Brevibacterium sp. 91QC2O2]|uniref:hypothetical protein n=1 Tax=Brevibacterium TaxID=1696 RepID=UPI00211CB566|nr:MULTISPECIES: hypothetical protein [unclassified Brevibacterium]MCQ9367367.1 hypothetical protein [Brevibacterium sp. 91QC2O2]MCQ9384620.1 hypothetical protein [Brevibacterium sp. 68QC2CO]